VHGRCQDDRAGLDHRAAGGIDPEHVVTPGIFVDRLVQIANPQQEEELIRAGVAYI